MEDWIKKKKKKIQSPFQKDFLYAMSITENERERESERMEEKNYLRWNKCYREKFKLSGKVWIDRFHHLSSESFKAC